MDYRLSYIQSVEESFPSELAASINPCLNLKNAFIETQLTEPSHLNVYLRIRPLLPQEQNETEEENIEILSDQSISMVTSSNTQSYKNNTKVSHNFTFSHVYGGDSSQQIIFEQTTAELVNEVIGGQNCLMFTYGATNSGKTFTIQGTENKPGLLPRTLVALFDKIGSSQYLKEDLKPHLFCSVIRLSEGEIRKEREIKDIILKSKDFSRVSSCSNFSYASCSSKVFDGDNTQSSNILDSTQASSVNTSPVYVVFISFAEIYNEYVYDLLEQIGSHRNIKRTPLALGEDKFGSIYIKGLKHVKVNSTEEALQVLEVGRQNLHFASTQINQNSSRSHCIFTIKLIRLFDPCNPHLATTSTLSLCDLAGAERATKTLNSHDRLKEASNINTSLLVLGRCIAALRYNQSVKHSIGSKRTMPVPYRDSKITRLFQSFFMGKGLLAMIVNVSTSTLLLDDTLKVLKFSAIARKVAIVPIKNYNAQPIEKHDKRSRFSRFMKHSLNMSKGSIRFSIPWANSTTTDVTFGAVDETQDCEVTKDETYEEENLHQPLLDLIKQLKDRLILETKKNEDMEKNIRKEICDETQERYVQIEHSHKIRLEEERSRNEELMEWRINRALETTDKTMSCRKRQRIEEGSDRSISTFNQFQYEMKSKVITEERDLLVQELCLVKATLKTTAQSCKALQEENSKLDFQQSILSEECDKAVREKEKTETALKSALSGSQTAESALIERKEQKISDLMKDLQLKQEENNSIKVMLAEAAEEFMEKEQQLTASRDTLAQQNIMLSDLENQLFEAKELITSHVTRLEERESEICELQEDIRQCNIAAKSDGATKAGLEWNKDAKFSEMKGPNQSTKNRRLLLKDEDFKNQSLIDFEKSEKKINSQHVKQEQINKMNHLETCLLDTNMKYNKIRKDFEIATDNETSLVAQLESKEKEIETLQNNNEELLQENATLKEAEAASVKMDPLSESLINNEDLSRCGEAPEDESVSLGEIEDLRFVLDSLKLNSVQDLEQTLLNAQTELASMTKQFNETDEELLAMCKLNEALQNEMLSNRNKINYLESDLYGANQKFFLANQELEEAHVDYKCRASLESKQNVEKQAEISELKSSVKHMTERNSQQNIELEEILQKNESLNLRLKSYVMQLRELAGLRIKVDGYEQEIKTMDTESTKLQEQVQNLTKKVESLDRELSENENNYVTKSKESEILSKQLAAIIEARKEELMKFESKIVEKDSEIFTLQKELKEAILGTKMNIPSEKNIKQEKESIHIVEEQLKQSEMERSNLVSYVSDLEKQLADRSHLNQKLEAELTAISLSGKGDSFLEVVDQSKCMNDLVTPVPNPRSTKGRSASKGKRVQSTEIELIAKYENCVQKRECYLTPISVCGKMNTRSSSKTRNESIEESKTRSRSTRGRRNVTFNECLEATSSLQNDGDCSSEEIPPAKTPKRQSTKKARGRGKKNCNVPNPHLPDEKDKENQRGATCSETRRSTRKRRPLYDVAAEQTLEGSPVLKLTDGLRTVDSPHTISRRQLRSKFK